MSYSVMIEDIQRSVTHVLLSHDRGHTEVSNTCTHMSYSVMIEDIQRSVTHVLLSHDRGHTEVSNTCPTQS